MPALDATRFAETHREAARAWPHVRVSEELFRAALERALEAGDASLDALHVGDLYLATACLAGDPAAITTLERDLMKSIRPSIERACRASGGADDIAQTTLTKLLFGPPEPKLRQYVGRGPLVGWVRVIAVREALQVQRRTSKEVHPDRFVFAETARSAETLELQLLRERHGASFEEAIRGAMARLDTEQRALLRFNVRDGLTIDQIAPLLGVHRATVARRLEKARGDVLVHTMAILRERHGLSESEAKSLCTALGSEVDVSLARALPEEASP